MTRPVTYRCHLDSRGPREHEFLGDNGTKVLCRHCNQKGPDCQGSMTHTRAYLLRAYGVDTWKGRRVQANAEMGAKQGRQGTVVGHRNGYVLIKWDDEKKPGLHHVLWGLDYLNNDGAIGVDGRQRTKEINAMYANLSRPARDVLQVTDRQTVVSQP